MIKLIIHIIVCSSCTLVLHAQKKYYEVELNPNEQIENLGFYCAEILDARLNKSNIGFAQKGIVNKRVDAKFIENFTDYLLQNINLMIPRGNSKQGLTLIFRDLTISEITGGTSESGYCRVEIEFSKKIDSSLYSLGIYEFTAIGKGMDVTKFHDERIIEAITECCRLFDSSEWKTTKGSIINNINHRIKYDYHNIPPEGVYFSFHQMARKTPLNDSIKYEIRQISESNKFRTFHVKFKHTRYGEHINFIVDDNSIYLRVNKFSHFIKSTHLGKYIYFKDRFSKPPSGAVMGAAFGFGVLGVVAIASIGTAKGLVIDTESGVVRILGDVFVHKATESYPDIRKEYRNSKRKLKDKEDVLLKLNEKFK